MPVHSTAMATMAAQARGPGICAGQNSSVGRARPSAAPSRLPVAEASGGSLELEIFPDGQLGTTADTLQQSASGELIIGYTDAAGFVMTSMVLENIGVSAYNGAAPYLQQSPDLLTAALTIHGVEARHASYAALLNGENPFPDAVNPYLTPAQVLEQAGPLIVGS